MSSLRPRIWKPILPKAWFWSELNTPGVRKSEGERINYSQKKGHNNENLFEIEV